MVADSFQERWKKRQRARSKSQLAKAEQMKQRARDLREVERTLRKREQDLAKREKALAKKTANFEKRWQKMQQAKRSRKDQIGRIGGIKKDYLDRKQDAETRRLTPAERREKQKALKDKTRVDTKDKNKNKKGQSNHWERIQQMRQRRIEKRCGKKLIHGEQRMLEYIAANQVPVMMQHCILKVYMKVDGSPKEKFISAFNICSACFSRYGYTYRGTMRKTGKGVKRNRMHQREKVAGQKKGRYKKLVSSLWSGSLKRMGAEGK